MSAPVRQYPSNPTLVKQTYWSRGGPARLLSPQVRESPSTYLDVINPPQTHTRLSHRPTSLLDHQRSRAHLHFNSTYSQHRTMHQGMGNGCRDPTSTSPLLSFPLPQLTTMHILGTKPRRVRYGLAIASFAYFHRVHAIMSRLLSIPSLSFHLRLSSVLCLRTAAGVQYSPSRFGQYSHPHSIPPSRATSSSLQHTCPPIPYSPLPIRARLK